MTIKYCIQCDDKVEIYQDPMGRIQEFHYIPKPHEDDYYVCEGPFVGCPPPEMTDEMWEATLERDDYTSHEEGLAEDFVI